MNDASWFGPMASNFASGVGPCVEIVDPFKHFLCVTTHPQILVLELWAPMGACPGQYSTFVQMEIAILYWKLLTTNDALIYDLQVSILWGKSQYIVTICDPLSENPALLANIQFQLEAILSVQVVFQLNSDYCTKVLQGACTVSYWIMKPGCATIKTL